MTAEEKGTKRARGSQSHGGDLHPDINPSFGTRHQCQRRGSLEPQYHVLIDISLSRNEGILSAHGALVTETGERTGRSPNDK